MIVMSHCIMVGEECAFMLLIKDETSRVIQDLENEIEDKNSYIIAHKLATHIKKIKMILDNRLSDKRYYRARIGTEHILVDPFSVFTNNYNEVAITYKGELISASKPIIAT
ncbi:hypothetical protein [Clostridium frigidicarnis]|uniref:Uncharacterized protein n=1 Tax=Clostridium frigidicarnis TaxID=84698 RepID=A0A1I0YEP6_9CLOT|nr:hypothetical protein [Clostridium frigidicarnis]SFB11267.1 hypothetical protein SAMN04488528_1012105 [Clostridium frigidicarnis]